MHSKEGQRRSLDSRAVTFRIYSKLIDEIDKALVGEVFYSNKPDFFLYALRKYFEFNIAKYNKIMIILRDFREASSEKKDLLPLIFLEMFHTTLEKSGMLNYEDFESEIRTVLVHIPVGLYDAIMEYIQVTGFYKSIQDFGRNALIYAILSDRSNRSVCSDVIKKSTDPLGLSIIKLMESFDWTTFFSANPSGDSLSLGKILDSYDKNE